MEVDDALTDEIMQMTTEDINFRTQMLGKKLFLVFSQSQMMSHLSTYDSCVHLTIKATIVLALKIFQIMSARLCDLNLEE